jgi:hypothetical protein
VKQLAGLFTTTPTGLQTYEIYCATSAIIPVVAELLREKFGFEPGYFLDGIDVYYLDCARPDCRITLGWDSWSGFFIQPNGPNPDWENILGQIGHYLDSQLENLLEFMDPALLAKALEEKE